MFVPVRLTVGAGEGRTGYNRIIETSDRFDALGTRVRDMTEPFTQIASDLHTQLEAAFATEGGTGATGRWQPLSEPYATWKEAHGGAPILVGLRPLHKGSREHPTKPESYTKSGRMREQLLVPLSDLATWHILPQRMIYAPLSNIAGFHQTGTENMPARPPVDPSVTFLHSIDRAFVSWMGRLMDEAGLGTLAQAA